MRKWLVKAIPGLAATILAGSALLGVAGVGVASDARALSGPFPLWCPGEYWDPSWGSNWDWASCHDLRMGDPEAPRPWEQPPPPPPPIVVPH
ncbi:hypothetical protein B2J96_07675 [Mycobacterium shigaense]|nr:hypothetical protein B2J96_07675 [Mycobacterium shigaense]